MKMVANLKNLSMVDLRGRITQANKVHMAICTYYIYRHIYIYIYIYIYIFEIALMPNPTRCDAMPSPPAPTLSAWALDDI
jgi:hypothetical protein